MRSGVGFFSSIAIAGGLLACGTPSIRPAEGDGGGPLGPTLDMGKLSDGGASMELPGNAPKCTDVQPPSKLDIGPTVNVSAGTFPMGCNAATDLECRADEKPQHNVTLPAFDIDKTEVTQAQYLACVKAGKCTYPKCPWDPCAQPDIPIACVKHAQALDYCSWAGKRLPSEAEWEKAARGTDGRKFPWGNAPITCDLANMNGCGDTRWSVGSKPMNASPYGALDMAGNVVEWTNDFYDPGYYAVSPPSAPVGPKDGTEYCGRGGGFKSDPIWHCTGSRDLYEPPYIKVSMGFRCAK